jgi:hypothetical protein
MVLEKRKKAAKFYYDDGNNTVAVCRFFINYICMPTYLYEAASEKAIHSPGMRIQSFRNHTGVHHYTPEEWMPTYKCRLSLDSNRKNLCFHVDNYVSN